MEHDWQWSEGGEGDSDTADLQGHDDLSFEDHLGGFEQHDLGGDDAGGHDLGGHDLGSSDLGGPDLGGHDFGDPGLGGHDAGGHDLGTPGHGGIEEPLGTEHATASYDESVGHAHDPDHTDQAQPGDHDPGAPGDHDAGHDPGSPAAHHDPGQDPGQDPGHDRGHDPGHDPGQADADHDPGIPGGPQEHEALVGTDPDLDHHADDPAWHTDDPFPPDLHLAAPQPVDGLPWSDPAALGDHTAGADLAGHGGSEDYLRMLDGGHDPGHDASADLARGEGIDAPPGGDVWSTLIGSEDPATSTLARWWSPGS
jgi:hypothetical protein